MIRVKIAEYFDTLRNELDLFTEIKINEDVEHDAFWNERREKQIDAINKIEQVGLAKANRLATKELKQDEESEAMRQVMSEFCFLIKYSGLLFVATVDRYVDRKEIETFQNTIKVNTMGIYACRKFFTDQEQTPGLYDLKFETDVVSKLEKIMSTDRAVVDLSWCFGQDSYHFDRVSCEIDLSLEEFTCPFRIRHLEIMIKFDPDSATIIDRARELCERTQNNFREAQSLSFIFHCIGSSSQLDTAKLDSLSLISSGNWEQRTSPEVRFDSCSSEKYYQKYCEEKDRESLLKSILVRDIVFYSLPTEANWNNIIEIEFFECEKHCVGDFDLSGFSSLKSIIFRGSYDSYDQHSFLYSVRGQLESLVFLKNGFSCLSWRMFRGMKKLKHLELNETEITTVKPDDKNQLFADLIQLKTLKMYINKTLLYQDWNCELPSLEELTVTFRNGYDSYSSNSTPKNMLRFNLPALTTFKCSHLYFTFEKDMTQVFSSLSHVQNMHVSPSYLRKGWFNGFKCIKLVCEAGYEGYMVDKELFAGLDSLREVELTGMRTVKEDAFRDLVNLQVIKIIRGSDWLKSNHGLFDGLRDLRVIYLSKRPDKDSFIYFENLNNALNVP